MSATTRLSARDLLTGVLDEGSFEAWDVPAVTPGPADAAYAAELAAARARTGLGEAVLTGEGRIHGRPVAVIACEFTFLAGSIGVAAAELLTAAVERATRERLPLLAATASGGTRMQEGTVAFLQMVKIAAAISAHKAAGLPYLVYLRHPTTGGVFASWASLGHITVAEPGALVGFIGPRVYEALHGRPFPSGIQVAEHLADRGVIDGVATVDRLRELADRTLRVLAATAPPDRDGAGPVPAAGAAPPDVPAWEAVVRSRDPRRPGVIDLLRHGASDVVRLNGTGEGETDPALRLALCRFGALGCVVVGQDRYAQRTTGPVSPSGLRAARRAAGIARELGLPLVTIIDTSGADLSPSAEERGLAGEIARCLVDLITLPAPTVAVLLGEGSGGGALALVPADTVLAAQHAWLAPLPPEGASALVHRDVGHAAELAGRQRIGAAQLLADGVVDRVIAEQPDAADEAEAFCRRVGAVIAGELERLARRPVGARLADRHDRYRRLGTAGR